MKKDYSLDNRPGDSGKTILVDGACNKNSPRVEAYGAVDELNSLIGMAAAEAERKAYSELVNSLHHVQEDLFVLGAELSTRSPSNQSPSKGNSVTLDMVKRLESEIREMNGQLEPVDKFVLPGGTPLASVLHFSRATCRRAERRILDLNDSEPVSKPSLAYINRLSDWLYLAARWANKAGQRAEITWAGR